MRRRAPPAPRRAEQNDASEPAHFPPSPPPFVALRPCSDLGNNSLSGTLPPVLGSLTALQHLCARPRAGAAEGARSDWLTPRPSHLHSNSLRGSLPSSLGSLSAVSVLRLDGNGLSGLVAPLATLAALSFANLSSNAFTGGLAPFSGLARLRVLALDHNALSGTLPSALGSLTSLLHLGASHNSLSGGVPAALAGLRSLRLLHLGPTSGLCGPLPGGLASAGLPGTGGELPGCPAALGGGAAAAAAAAAAASSAAAAFRARPMQHSFVLGGGVGPVADTGALAAGGAGRPTRWTAAVEAGVATLSLAGATEAGALVVALTARYAAAAAPAAAADWLGVFDFAGLSLSIFPASAAAAAAAADAAPGAPEPAVGVFANNVGLSSRCLAAFYLASREGDAFASWAPGDDQTLVLTVAADGSPGGPTDAGGRPFQPATLPAALGGGGSSSSTTTTSSDAGPACAPVALQPGDALSVGAGDGAVVAPLASAGAVSFLALNFSLP